MTAARKLVWKHGKFLLKHIFPTRIEGQVTFSFEDPALTGAALAVLGMTIPFHKNCIQINPRFDSENLSVMETSGQKAGSTDLFLCGQQ